MDRVIETRGLRLQVSPEVYTPREDSFLMVDQLSKADFTEKYLMEIGPGSGIISLSLVTRRSTVLAVDIAPPAAYQTLDNAKRNGFSNFQVIISSLAKPFRASSIPKTVIFNPPYLPEDPEVDPYSPQHELYQLVGGPKGYETVSELLHMLDPKDHLLFTIVSSLATNPVEFAQQHPRWTCRVIATENMGFEIIWILRLGDEI